MHLILTADGGSRGNPGPSAYGFAIWLLENQNVTDKNLILDILLQQPPYKAVGKYIGSTTNNQAEWQGVLAGLEYIKSNLNNYTSLYIALDSELVVKQLIGQYKVKNPGLVPLHKKAKDILLNFKNYSINHIYRQYNKVADSLVNIELDRI